jgi:HEAT repeat protein
MAGEASPPSEAAPAEETPERRTTPFLVLQFFIFPMAIVAVCVTVFVVFGLIASEGQSARGYLAEIRTGNATRRWQAAFELSKQLQARTDEALADPRFGAEMVALFNDSVNEDPRVRRYLALALGRLGDRRAVPSLLKVVAGGETDSETVIYSVWALGAIGDPAAAPELVKLERSEDPGIRKAVAHALGSLPSPEAAAALRGALQDSTEDVRWNAAVALARRGDAAATPVLLQMMDRSHLASVAGLSSEQADEAVLQAIAASAKLPEPELRAALARLRDSDPSLKGRAAAQEAAAAPEP